MWHTVSSPGGYGSGLAKATGKSCPPVSSKPSELPIRLKYIGGLRIPLCKRIQSTSSSASCTQGVIMSVHRELVGLLKKIVGRPLSI